MPGRFISVFTEDEGILLENRGRAFLLRAVVDADDQ
jgi:hypothetical protein